MPDGTSIETQASINEGCTAKTQSWEKPWLLRLQNSILQIFNQEKRLGQPDISVDFTYNVHTSADDIVILRKKIAAADIFVPESNGWSPEGLHYRRFISSGKYTVDDFFEVFEDNFSERTRAELEATAGTQKPIAMIDIYDEIKDKKNIQRIGSDYNAALDSYGQGITFGALLGLTRRYLKEDAELDQKREDFMISRFPHMIEGVLRRHPELRKRNSLNVLIDLGLFHTRVSQGIERAGYKITRNFSTPLFVFNHVLEAQRRFMFGKEVDDLLIARALLQKYIYRGKLLAKIEKVLGGDPYKGEAFLRKSLSKFTYEDIRSLFDKPIDGVNSSNLGDYALQQKGIEIPKTIQELDGQLVITN